MLQEKYLFLEATEHNWGLMGLGSWNHTTWQIYSDGSFVISNCFNPKEDNWPNLNPIVRERKGKMKPAAFEKLASAAAQEWHNGCIPHEACDGTAWEFTTRDESGKEIQYWKIGYIYGHPVMEAIEDALPPLTMKDTEEL